MHKLFSSSYATLENSLQSERLCIRYVICYFNLPKISKMTIRLNLPQGNLVALILELPKSSNLTIIFENLVPNLHTLLFLTTYCVWYPHTVPFLKNEMPYSLLKTLKTHSI